MEVTAKHIRARISPKKVVPVMDLVRGKSLYEAKRILSFDRTKAAKIVLKVVKSAEANAVNNNSLTSSSMILSKIWVGPGPVMKTGMWAGHGKFKPILKRTAHIYVSLSSMDEEGNK